ncbi:DedA family protein [Kitasatospora sp. GP82]|uniref:DedA family protein n=1 Tax=Kitasatospora sp. GP82 TaxID=3035089 RepID=UPI00247355F0|nr:DedA family protein [Kitasatospora sp. GP82]MDH6124918.1 membrane protein DedA with SNARE-associated domain [Kitasatospora sp. GP82]
MPAPPLPGPLAHLAPLLDSYGYPAVGALVFLDNCAVPVPGQTILVLAAVYAGTGRLSIAGVATIAVLAAVAGHCTGYLIGRTGGLGLLHRWGRYLLITEERLQRADRFFGRHGPKVVAVARFIDGLRQTGGIIAGAAELDFRRFFVADVIGGLLWVGAWASIGYVAGSDIGPLYSRALHYQLVLLIAVGAAVVAAVAVRLLRRRRRPGKDGPGSEGDGDGSGGGSTGSDGAQGRSEITSNGDA